MATTELQFKRFHGGPTYTAGEALNFHLLHVDPYEYGGELERLKEQVDRLQTMLIKLALLLPEQQLAQFVEETTYMERVKAE